MKNIYTCKCGCNDTYVQPKGRRFGVYCSKCDSWIEWITYSKANELFKKNDTSFLDDTVATRKIFKKSGITTMRCSKCDCLLYNSCKSKIEGQFDLVNAKFCPKCGREFI